MSDFRWQAMVWKARGWAAGALLAVALAGVARAEAPAAGAPVRSPRIRQIEAGRDDPARQRLEAVRQLLPEKFRRRRNFAWAIAKIDGLEKVEYFAHSGVDRRGEISAAAAAVIEDISVRPKKGGRFEVLCVNRNDEVEGEDCFPRYSDTEYKILEELASRLPDPSARGRVRLYTDLPPCASCRHVMRQFLAVYTNVQMQVLFRGY
ncbi:MAG: hypothetical protein EOM72_07695 [Opitutae bacterium]|nr:hypothetical protein [Opitutae bacterium]